MLKQIFTGKTTICPIISRFATRTANILCDVFNADPLSMAQLVARIVTPRGHILVTSCYDNKSAKRIVKLFESVLSDAIHGKTCGTQRPHFGNQLLRQQINKIDFEIVRVCCQ